MTFMIKNYIFTISQSSVWMAMRISQKNDIQQLNIHRKIWIIKDKWY